MESPNTPATPPPIGITGDKVLIGAVALTPDEADAYARKLKQFAKLARGMNVRTL